MWQRLSLDPNVRAAALADQIPERTVVQRPASNEAEAKYTPIYPLYLTNGYDRNRYKLSELSPNNIAVTGGACGVPAGYSSSSNSAIGLLALSDMLAAFKQAVEGKPKDDKSRLASALRDEVLQRASAPPADQPDPLSSAEHAAYRPHLTACVLGWADALDCTARWVDSAAQCAAQAGIGSPQAPVLPAAALLQLLSDQPEMPPGLQATGSPLPSPYNLSRPESPLAGGEGQPLREFCSRSTNPSPPLASPQHSAPSPTARAASAALAAAAFCGTRPSGSMELINTGVGQLALAESGQLPHAPTPLGVLRQLRVVLAHAAVTAEPLAASHPALAQGVRALQASVAAAVQAAEAGAAEGPLRPPVTSWGAVRVEAGPGTAAGPSGSQWAPAAAGRADGMMGLMESSLGGGMEASLWGAPYAAAAAPQQLVAQGAGQLQGTLPSSAASGPAQPGHNAGREVELASGLTAAMSAPPALFNRRLGSALKANSACAINDSGSGSGFQQFLTDILAPGSTLAGAAAGAAGGSQEARVPTGPACPPRRPPQPMGIFQGNLIPGFDQAYPAGAPCAAGGGGAMAMETSQGGLSAAAPLAHALTAPPAMAARPVPPVQPPPVLPPPPVPPPPRRNVFDDPNLLPPGPLPAPMLRGPSDHVARPCDRSRERERSGAHGRGGWDERGERSRGYDLLSPGTDGLPADVYMSLGSLADLEHFGSIVAEGPGALAGGRF
ncbi:hypothetical protein HYH03_016826 [Edaphochlamys debaryana]|uniref:Uncharacterized protein n=1 Tax=Edaphochlamys debaryana TaxID=47281 RepID=A0A835XGW5_9CHLO|nr:hypothetical protein HYH03_016826 [Edaphochlamys debaryana]|eukprot:KAG2484412.1 hypothetical protein HYH03_016826 [Edaphochlamys debaryana]